MKPPVDKQLILDSIIAMAKESGRAPSRSKFLSLSGISEHQVSQFFSTWSDAVRAAGLFPHTMNRRLEDRELFEDWAFVVRTKGKIPSRRAYPHLGQYDPSSFGRFGPWSKLPEAFRNFAQGKPEWADVVALLPIPPVAQALLPVSQPKLSRQREPKPGSVILSEAKDPGVIVTQLKSVQTATIPASPNSAHPLNCQSSSAASAAKLRYPPLKGRPTYGHPLDFRGLRHEPINELGVVLLFGLVAKELGYIVESVQSGFPDCEAKRQTGPQQWQRVHIEFEFESRNFRTHGHPFNGCDVIVCWRHNWPDCPPQIEILELSSLIQSLPTSED